MGCPTSYDGMSATWTRGKLSRLSSGTLASGTTSYVYNYNAYGQRVSKAYSYLQGTSSITPVQTGEVIGYNKQYYYDHSGRLIAEKIAKTLYPSDASTEQIVYLYDESSIIGMAHTLNGVTNTYYFHRNLQGDVVAIYDTSGNMVAKYLYDAWGNCTISSETTNTAVANANPIRYRGYYYDDDTGLYYCNARYYSPKWRRFISPDDTAYLDPESVNGLNLYCYCNNDPVNYADPSGHFVIALSIILWAAAIGAAVGLTAGGLAGAAVAACNDTDILAGFISGAIGGAIMGAGAGVGALFLAPLVAGECVIISVAGGMTMLSTGAAITTGLTIGGVTGVVGGVLADLGNQLGNNGMDWRKVDYGSVAVSAVEYGTLNMFSTGLGSLMGPYLSNSMNFLGSKLLNVIPTGWGFVIDVLRGQL